MLYRGAFMLFWLSFLSLYPCLSLSLPSILFLSSLSLPSLLPSLPHTQTDTHTNTHFRTLLSLSLMPTPSLYCPLHTLPFNAFSEMANTHTPHTSEKKARYMYAGMRVNTDNPQRGARTVVHSVPSPAWEGCAVVEMGASCSPEAELGHEYMERVRVAVFRGRGG